MITDLFLYLFQLVKGLHPVIQILAIPVIAFVFLLFKSKDFRTLVHKFVKKSFRLAGNKSVLSHDLFFNKKVYLNQIKQVGFISEHKTELFQILLKKKVSIVIDETFTWLKKYHKTFRKLHYSQFQAMLQDHINNLIAKYEFAIKAEYIKIHGQKRGIELFNLIYQSENGFKKYHDDNVRFIFKNIEKLAKSQAKNRIQQIRTFLLQIDVAIDISITDCEEVFDNLNGRIEEYIKN